MNDIPLWKVMAASMGLWIVVSSFLAIGLIVEEVRWGAIMWGVSWAGICLQAIFYSLLGNRKTKVE